VTVQLHGLAVPAEAGPWAARVSSAVPWQRAAAARVLPGSAVSHERVERIKERRTFIAVARSCWRRPIGAPTSLAAIKGKSSRNMADGGALEP
jgi:hypothetical protein